MIKSLQEFEAELKAAEGKLASCMIADVFDYSKRQREKERLMRARYYGREIPIAERVAGKDGISNKLQNDFRGDIVDSFTGYIFGNDLKYIIKPERYKGGNKSAQFIKDQEFFDYFCDKNQFSELDLETGKNQSICGKGARLCYIEGESIKGALSQGAKIQGLPRYRVIDIKPSECVFVYEGTTNRLQCAFRFYRVWKVDLNGNNSEFMQCEFYDDKTVRYYIGDSQGRSWTKNKDDAIHGFSLVPLFEFENNKERQGDFEKVESLIDAYDKIISDGVSEIEAFRMAYLVVSGGAVISDAGLEKMKRTGCLSLPDANMKMSYLVKSSDGTFIDSLLDRLQKNIYRFSKTVDTTSDTFTGSGASGEARKWALLGFENKATLKINKFKKALKYQFDVLASAWNDVGISITSDILKIEVDRNLPVELLAQAQTAGALKGLVSDRTILSTLSFVDNPDDEMARMQEEAKEKGIGRMGLNLIDLDNVGE
jgi:SPP1 family phage portal protein